MIDWRYVLVKVSYKSGQRPRTRLAQLIARRKSGMAPWEVEVMFYSRAVKRAPRPIRVNVSDLVAGWAWQPTPAELRATRKSLPVTI